MDSNSSELARRLENLKNKVTPAQPVEPTQAVPLVHPQLDIDLGEISDEERELDAQIKAFDIVQAYIRWCGKSQPKAGRNQKDSIKVSCPNPAHPDKHPSAWLNREKNLYFCSGCAVGGDVFDIAAYHFGYPVPGYKQDRHQFRELREKMIAGMGLSHTTVVVQEDEAPAPPSNVVPLHIVKDEEQAPVSEMAAYNEAAPSLDWRTLVPEDTFLRAWMDATTKDTCPEEYHFWTGLMAIGFAIGRNRTLRHNPDVKPNLFVCLVGPSGAGKSRAKRHLNRVIREVLPFDDERPEGQGTKIIVPNSAEYMVDEFSIATEDINTPGQKIFWPVRVHVDFDELSKMVGLADRKGAGNFRPLLQEIYDADDWIETGSRGSGRRRAFQPFGQASTTTQNRALRKLFSRYDDDSGFLNRWVFASGKLKPRDPLGGPTVDLTEAKKHLTKIFVNANFSPKVMEWGDGVADLWVRYSLDYLEPLQLANENTGSAMLNRLDLLLMKIMILLSVNMNQDFISIQAFEQMKAICTYLVASYRMVIEDLDMTDDIEQTDAVVEAIKRWIAKHGTHPTAREIHNSVARKFPNKAEFNKHLETLAELGHITREIVERKPGVKGRAPAPRWVVNE